MDIWWWQGLGCPIGLSLFWACIFINKIGYWIILIFISTSPMHKLQVFMLILVANLLKIINNQVYNCVGFSGSNCVLCPDGFFTHADHCHPCPESNCKTCNNYSPYTCTECSTRYGININNGCQYCGSYCLTC